MGDVDKIVVKKWMKIINNVNFKKKVINFVDVIYLIF